MKNNKVSICIPMYNAEEYIERCASSLFKQTYNNIEYIFVNDVSTDDTVNALKKTIDCYPHRKKQVKIVYNENNIGSAGSRNMALKNSTGDFIMWVDADDYIDIDTVKECIKKQEEKDYDIILFDHYQITKKGLKRHNQKRFCTIRERTIGLLKRDATVSFWGMLYKASLHRENNIYCIQGIDNNDDYHVTPRLSYYSKSIGYIEMPFYYYECQNENSITSKFSEKKANQGWLSIEVLSSFFNDKGQDYKFALTHAIINRIALYLKLAVETKQHSIFVQTKEKQRIIAKKDYKLVPKRYKPFLYIDHFGLLRIYYLGHYYIKQLINLLSDFLWNL